MVIYIENLKMSGIDNNRYLWTLSFPKIFHWIHQIQKTVRKSKSRKVFSNTKTMSLTNCPVSDTFQADKVQNEEDKHKRVQRRGSFSSVSPKIEIL